MVNIQLKNKTLEIHKRISKIVLVVYLAIIQIFIACTSGDLLDEMLLSLFDPNSSLYLFFSQTTVSVFINIILFGSCYIILYSISNLIYKKIWVVKNKDCYLSGRWYHIHTKENDSSYIRCGVVEIKQNYFDMDIEGSNFAPLKIDTSNANEWKIVSSNNNVSYWRYDVIELTERGGILATYTSNKVTGSTRTFKGLHQLRVIDHDGRGYPSILGGSFSDIAPSTSVGHLRLYRAYPVSNIIFTILYQLKYTIDSSKNELIKLRGKNLSNVTINKITNYSYDTMLSQGPRNWKKTLKILLDKANPEKSVNMENVENEPLLSLIEKKIIKIVKEAGELVLSASTESMESAEKTSSRDIYTVYDVAVQKRLINELSSFIKCASFIAEESEWDKQESLPTGYCFIIDPIDGTSNFSRNYKHSCISVGLAINKEIMIGVVYDPYLNETFHAIKGHGAYLDKDIITCSNAALKHSLVGFGTAPYNPELFHETFAFSEELFHHCNDLRRSGSSALDVCYVASSRLDFFYELSLFPWDYGASGLIATEAGAIISDLEGLPLSFTKKCSVACGGPIAYEEFMQVRRDFVNHK